MDGRLVHQSWLGAEKDAPRTLRTDPATMRFATRNIMRSYPVQVSDAIYGKTV